MNRNRYQLVFNPTSGMMVPVAETARRQGKAAGGPALALVGALLAPPALAELPVPGAGGAIPDFVAAGQAAYQTQGTQAYVNQVGNKAILNWQRFNVSPGHDVQFRQVDSLATNHPVQGARFTSLNRIWDINPSIIAGSMSQAAGQKANVILVNSNGIAFMGGSQVNLNQFTATTLNIQDDFIGNLLAGTAAPQFEKALDGSEARGFIKVMDGARISAGNSGRVMLIAPTVVNRGTVEAPDGQIVLAAASKAYLRASDDDSVRGLLIEVDSPSGLNSFGAENAEVKEGVLDGRPVALTNPADDQLGHATNLGALSTPRGNLTMVGYAVNQRGIARATTSVVANGSVYLMAKDTASLPGTQNTSSQRTGQVTLGAGSITEIVPEAADTTSTQDGKLASGAANAGMDFPSRILVVGRDIRVEGDTVDGNGRTTAGAQVRAPAGRVGVYAVEAGVNTTVRNLVDEGGLLRADTAVSGTTRLHVGKGARFDVAGLENVAVAVTRNAQEVELRGDELKDSPMNRVGPIRNEKVYVDVERALTRALSGESTLISRDRLESLRAQEQRTVAERSTQGGTVELLSQGEAIVEAGVQFDVSGGSLNYMPGNVKTTLLSSNGRLVDMTDADAETRYDGIATRYVIDYGKWNRKEVIDFGQSYRFDTGYLEGKDAGVVAVFGMNGTVMQTNDMAGRTVTGERQRAPPPPPRGAQLVVGYDDVSATDLNRSGAGYQDYKLNQRVEVVSNGALLPAGFAFGDALPGFLKSTLTLDPSLLGVGKVAELSVFSNQAVALRAALAAPANGTVTVAAPEVTVGADIDAGAIDIAARYARGQTLPATPSLTLADGVALRTRGQWVNDLPGMEASSATPRIDGGVLTLNAESIADGPGSYSAKGEIVFGENVTLDADSGGWLKANGKLVGGKGGTISVQGFSVAGWENVDAHAYGIGKGGALTLGARRIQVGGVPLAVADAIDLDAGLFTRGGFTDYSLKALSSLTVADNTHIRAAVQNRELATADLLRASGTPVADLGQLAVRDDRVRQAVNINLSARLKAAETGDLVIGENARIESDPNATITLQAYRLLDIEGSVATAGGVITASADNTLGTVWLGDAARLDAGGRALTYTDDRGLTQGEVMAGGQVSMSAGNVVTKTNSVVDIAGVAPVNLDVPNELGGLGRAMGSDAGTFTVLAQNRALLDGNIQAHGGSASQRGGVLDVTLGIFEEPALGTPLPQSVLALAQSAPAQSAGLQVGDSLLATQTIVAADKIKAAGFDRVRLSSRDAIRLENGLVLGVNRTLPLREVTLDAASIQTAGGDAGIAAETVRLGNYHPGRRAASTATTRTGTLTVEARQLELAGKLALEGMARAELKGADEIRLAGVSVSNARPEGELNATADLLLHGALVAPTSYSLYSINAAGQSVAFRRNMNTPVQPWSALGSLTVRAADIVQDGNLWAPFGVIDLQAGNALTFKAGSLTSAAAAPGSLTPFGKVENGRSWVFDTDASKVDKLEIADLDGKAIRASGATVDMQPGARIDLSGGGDIQAYEFTTGPGGSRDILTDANTYAVVPGYTGGYAMADAQNDQSRRPGESAANKAVFDRAPGDAMYLSGVPGLVDGVYTLLPAHYALLPGAYAVKMGTVGQVLPGQAYSREDGVRIAAGHLTDTRAHAPVSADWQGIEVLTREQVLARSEFSVAHASAFFVDGRNRPQDAGLLSVATTGSSASALKLDAIYDLAAAPSGRGAQMDISALKLALVSGMPPGIDPAAVVLDVDALNNLGADSIFIGGTRRAQGNITMLDVQAETVTLANDAGHALQAAEVILGATDTVDLQAGSQVNAQGDAREAGHYETAGEGALVRAASTQARYSRTGSPGATQGTLTGSGTIIAADSIILDATKDNAFRGATQFSKEGQAVAGNLAVGAVRVSLGAAPAGTPGMTYSQVDLGDLNNLNGLTLTSYGSFDLYGDVDVGGVNLNGKPTLRHLTLNGAGLAGLDNAGKTANLRATHLTLANPAGVAFTPGGVPGTGTLAILADTLTLGAGDKAIQGYRAVTISANELVGIDKGTTGFAAPLNMAVARISGTAGSSQSLAARGALKVASRVADRTLAPVTALGARWALTGTAVDFNSSTVLPSGQIALEASGGDVTLGSDARIDVAGRSVAFFDVDKPSWGGTAQFQSASGDVVFDNGAKVDVSAAAGGDAGTLIVHAIHGEAMLADGSMIGARQADVQEQRGDGARAHIDTGTLASFSALNGALNSGGFDGERSVRVRNGDVILTAGDEVKAHDISVTADGGRIDVAGRLDVSNGKAGRISLLARDDVDVRDTAELRAVSSSIGTDGGDIEIGTRNGTLNLAAGSRLDVTAGVGGEGGTLLFRTPRVGNDVAVAALDGTLNGARSVTLEAVKVYDGVTTLTATGASSGTLLSLATIDTDNIAFAVNQDAIKARLGAVAADPAFHLVSGVEVRSTNDITLAQDWNLKDSRAGGEAGMLTLRAAGNLKLNRNLSDGFNVAAPLKGAAPATLLTGQSWSYRLVGGADNASADPLATLRAGVPGQGNVEIAAGKLVRTGTGTIRMAAGGDIELKDDKAVIYTAGRVADPVSGFAAPNAVLGPVFSQQGGDVALRAQGDILGKATAQLYSQWLYRQGAINAATGLFDRQPAWWVRFDQFQQGIGTLGGGDVSVLAGGAVKDFSVSAPTQGRTASSAPDAAELVVAGGGDVRVEAGTDILGGTYYAGRGNIRVQAGGHIETGGTQQPVVALGDAEARLRAGGNVVVSNAISPHLLPQSPGNLRTVFPALRQPVRSLFSTYGTNTSLALDSLSGKATLGQNAQRLNNANTDQPQYLLPPSLSMTSFQGDIGIGEPASTTLLTMSPSASGGIELLAQDSVVFHNSLTLSDMDLARVPDAVNPTRVIGSASSDDTAIPRLIVSPLTPRITPNAHATRPLHENDAIPVRVYARSGDVSGINTALTTTVLNTPKRLELKAGGDVHDLAMHIQNVSETDVSSITAGKSVVFATTSDRRDNAQIRIGGPGRLEVTAGKHIDLGTSGGIVSRGNLDNGALPSAGASLRLAAGIGDSGIDYAGAVDRVLAQLETGSPAHTSLWLARWLAGNDTLTAGEALVAMQALDKEDAAKQKIRVETMLYTALRSAGRDSLNPDSPYAADYMRGYAALAALFPGIEYRNAEGAFQHYKGNINLFASRVKTEQGGGIDFMAPGGDVIVGLANTPAALVNTGNNVLGLVVSADGDIRGFARDDVLVNQSRILTVGGGDVLLWSSEGDIDAGKGKKSASAVPPPIVKIDPASGLATLELLGAVSGSGIGALSTGGVSAGDVDLIAPRGAVNAGDAGIRAGNLNIAAQVVLGADNISVSGTSAGTPVADTSAVSAASSGASNAGGEVSSATAALSQNLADAARAAEELKQAFKPTFITAEVIGHGE